MSDRRRWGRVLRACVTEHDWDEPPAGVARLVSGRNLDPLLQLAHHHRVENLLYLSLRRIPGADAAALGALERWYAESAARHLRIESDLAAAARVLDAEAIPWIIFKGPVLGRLVYPRSDLRTFDDLDILVPRGSFRGAVEALEGAGARLLDRNWELIESEYRGQLHLVLGGGTLADLHWHLLNRESVRRSFAIDIEGIFERARASSLGELPVRTLDPADSLLHLCVHAALSGGDRLGWLKDVERSIVALPPPWEEVVKRARRWRVRVPVATTLGRAAATLGAPVPSWVAGSLAPGKARSAIEATVVRLWPTETARGRVSPLVVWSQACRDGAIATATALAQRVTRRPTLGLRRRLRGQSWRRSQDGRAAVLIPTGGPDARAAFFRRVGGAARGGGAPAPAPQG